MTKQVFLRAKLAYFYKWSHEYIESLPYRIALEYFEAITVIEAQNFLADLTKADYPNLKKEDRRKIHREMHNKAYPYEEQKPVSAKEMARILSHGRR